MWGADVADMHLISKWNKEVTYLLSANVIFTKYAWVVTLKDKKGATIFVTFQIILGNSERKTGKIWIDQGS